MSMSEDFKTLREVSIAFIGVQRQFTWLTGVIAVCAAGGLAIAGAIYVKMDKLTEATIKIESRLGAMENSLEEINKSAKKTLSSVGEIKDKIQYAETPVKNLMSGYIGAKILNPQDMGGKFSAVAKGENIWVLSNNPASLDYVTKGVAVDQAVVWPNWNDKDDAYMVRGVATKDSNEQKFNWYKIFEDSRNKGKNVLIPTDPALSVLPNLPK